MNKSICLLLALLLAGCAGEDEGSGRPEDAGATHIDHFARLSPNVFRGAQPVGDAAFQELRNLGVRTIISVDAARPDVATAARHGIRYVHIPFGYDRVPAEDQARIAKTVRELPGPFFVHCHHGKHRGPAGAVIAQMALGGMSPGEGVAELHRAGTSNNYKGLYASVRECEVPSAEATAALPFDFPEIAPVDEIAGAMAEVDRRYDGLKVVREAGWQASEEHPDIDPPHEALQLRELFVEIGRTEEAAAHEEPFDSLLQDAVEASRDLERALRADTRELEAIEKAYGRLSSSCKDCHSRFRNR